ncbi:MAG: type II restriction endonuclease [Rhodobacter sp.]|nr:type II restriction endonuclease [Rhodobacter sp.]
MTDGDTATRDLIRRWKDDPSAAYQTWFLWSERVKNFRSIRRGLQVVVAEIAGGTFGNAYRGSSLETVVHSIAEQRQIFRGADHAFLWKPKLRIPDIYESPANQRAFGQLIDGCTCCSTEGEIIRHINVIDRCAIKGLGPAVANLLYFLHPTLVPPFNTRIVEGYNRLTGAKVKLGSWPQFLAMRAGIIDINHRFRDLLSNDLGAIGALLFDIGSDRYPAPPRDNADAAAFADRLRAARDAAAALTPAEIRSEKDEASHSEVQSWLRDLGHALGYRVWIAANDRGRLHAGEPLGRGCLDALPGPLATAPGAEAVRLIDVLWLSPDADRVAAAFEVEHSTSIYSGVCRMLDLALGHADPQAEGGLFLVAPDAREAEVRAQLARPAFARIADLKIGWLPYGELARHRDAIARFGEGLKAIRAITRPLP